MATWQNELKSLFHSYEDLLEYLEISNDLSNPILHPTFPIRVPRSFADRMRKGERNDPLLLQVLPSAQELIKNPISTLSNDPLKEAEFTYSQGVLQKFQGRVLIVSTGYCPVHCRYCFRRHFDYADRQISLKDWGKTLTQLKADTSISEVIFSGGDPLTLPDNKLEALFNDLKKIPHIRTIRLHSRFPIVIPSRLTEALKALLKDDPTSPIRIVTVLHINHAQELDQSLSEKLRKWSSEGVLFFNQAVLLQSINDSLNSQIALWRRCFESGVLAYYLHQFDRVEGAGHFEVSLEKGQSLIAELRKSLPGYMIPLYVQEIPFAGSKIPLESYVDKFLP